MSQQALDLRGFLRVVRRYRTLVGVTIGLGIVGGVLFAAVHPALRTSKALVILPAAGKTVAGQPARSIETQAVIAGSDPVLAGAIRGITPAVSLPDLRIRVDIGSVTPDILAISARGRSSAQAEATANAVAGSFLAYINTPGNAGGELLERATTAIGTPLPERLVVTGALGALLGVLGGSIIAVAVSGANHRLRERDEIAAAIGIPVLASIPAGHPSDAAGWTKLLQRYEPGAEDAWNMRKALHQLGLTSGRAGGGTSLAVVTLSTDRRAIALGPQLAVFAASLGISTSLVIGSRRNTKATAALLAACSAQPQLRDQLQVSAEDREGDSGPLPAAALTIVVAVVDGRSPRLAGTMPTTETVLGVSAGGVTAEQLARAAAGAADDGHDIGGIIVADPDPADQTTGRLPQSARLARRRQPTRMTSVSTETRW